MTEFNGRMQELLLVWTTGPMLSIALTLAAVEQPRQFARDTRGAHIIGDVALHVARGQTQLPAIHEGRHRVGGVIAGDQPARARLAIDDFKGFVCHRAVISFAHALGQKQPEWNCRRSKNALLRARKRKGQDETPPQRENRRNAGASFERL